MKFNIGDKVKLISDEYQYEGKLLNKLNNITEDGIKRFEKDYLNHKNYYDETEHKKNDLLIIEQIFEENNLCLVRKIFPEWTLWDIKVRIEDIERIEE